MIGPVGPQKLPRLPTVQRGQRTQNSGSNRALGHRSQKSLAYVADANDLAAATKSTARLEAEAAFATLQVRSLPQLSAQVIVRRTRSANFAGKPTPEGDNGSTTQLTAKCSRVFRVEAPPPSRSLEASFAALPPPAEASTHNRSMPAQAAANPTARRIATDRRPGPVLHVIHAPPERKREAGVPRSQFDLLTGELERVNPILEIISRAQAFCLLDKRVAREWLRLSRKVDELHAHIRAQMR